MKKLIITALSICMAGACAAYTKTAPSAAYAETSPAAAVNCKSAYLCDYNSGECIYKHNETLRLPIASVCKVMTLNLCFEAIAQGKLDPQTQITVSERAAGMGGSQIFLQSGLTYPLGDLIKSVIVCSANDSCVAISETVAGSEEQFVALMNSRAAEYGCPDTLFANCTGLPKDTQYSCAKDVATMFIRLIGNEEYFKYSKIWLEDFGHPDDRTTTMTNTNKLIKKYSYCDGGKTGFTNEAGFCLASTAKRDNLRLVSVVLGADSSDDRFSSAVGMFDYGFANYKNAIVLDSAINLSDKVRIAGGKKSEVSVRPARPSFVFSPKDATPDIKYNFIPCKISAPVKKGDPAGKIEVYKNGVLYDTVDAVTSEEAEKAGYGDYIKKVAGEWAV